MTIARNPNYSVLKTLPNDSIMNLTQHKVTDEQFDDGAFDLYDPEHDEIIELLTFRSLPTVADLQLSAQRIADIAASVGQTRALIGGAPYLMPYLERALIAHGIQPLYAFSLRQSVEVTAPDGTVTKTSMFKHMGFVPACAPLFDDVEF